MHHRIGEAVQHRLAEVQAQLHSKLNDLDRESTEQERVAKLARSCGVVDAAYRAGDPTAPQHQVNSDSAGFLDSDLVGDDDGLALPDNKPPKTLRETIWRVLNEPASSKLATIIAVIVVAMISLSVIAFIIQTLPEYVFSTDASWAAIEYSCIAIFTVEFLLRVFTCPSVAAFFKEPLNLVDLLAILPFYVEILTFGTGGGSSAGIIRVLRLVRIFRIFKVARYLPWVRVFTYALMLSIQPLLMLVLVVVIGMVVFSSGMYYAERGEWDASVGAWRRAIPNSEAPGPAPISPFQSIPAAMWWGVITMTTVGYGDTYPVTPVGKVIASVAALSGILVVAIPITVISTNFNAEYARMERQKAKVRARLMLLQHHFTARRAGLDAVLDEVEDLVKRNTQEFQSEVHSLFEASRAELTEEIQEVIRMAFERRRQLHLAALAAGRVQGSVTVPQ